MATLDKNTAISRTRREILRDSDRIPALPDVVVKVISLLNDPSTEPEALAAHLQNDLVLVAKMLAMVNSAYYGLNREISSIKEAVMILGFRGLRTLTVTAGTSKYLERDYRCYGHTDKGLWMHSLAVAAAAGDLAKSTGQTPELREEVFVAGLLHDIGKMVLSPHMRDTNLDPGGPTSALPVLEQGALGIDHGEAGAMVCAKWNLSDLIQDTLAHHHDETSPPNVEIPCAIVRLADALAHQRGSGYNPDRAPEHPVVPGDLEILSLDATSWEAARSSAEAAVGLALASFQKLLS